MGEGVGAKIANWASIQKSIDDIIIGAVGLACHHSRRRSLECESNIHQSTFIVMLKGYNCIALAVLVL